MALACPVNRRAQHASALAWCRRADGRGLVDRWPPLEDLRMRRVLPAVLSVLFLVPASTALAAPPPPGRPSNRTPILVEQEALEARLAELEGLLTEARRHAGRGHRLEKILEQAAEVTAQSRTMV